MVEIKPHRIGTERLARRAISFPADQLKEIPPKELNNKNVIYWSTHYKKLMNVPEGKSIQTNARIFLKNNCIKYDKETKSWKCYPRPGNKQIHTITQNGKFECTCQFFNRVCKRNPGLICSHILALYMYLKIRNWKKRVQ